tara:strand:+ start:1936 stop:2271 length:336 start_codon:yes stop_codon:yes gene_type:complete
MFKYLVFGKVSSEYQDHISKKQKSDAMIELQKITKSLGGEYVLRQGIIGSDTHDACAIIQFKNRADGEANKKAVLASGLLINFMSFELADITKVEETIMEVSKRLKIVSNK